MNVAQYGPEQASTRPYERTRVDPQERRRQILDRSAEIFARKGVSATTIREIADAVGVYSGALYHYFPSKEAIVTELIREYITDLNERCREVLTRNLPPVERIEALTRIALETSADYHGATSIWRREGEYMRERVVEADMVAAADAMQVAWSDTIREGITEGLFRTDIDPEAFRHLLYDAVWHTSRWYLPGPDRSLADLAHVIVSLFVDGFRRRDT